MSSLLGYNIVLLVKKESMYGWEEPHSYRGGPLLDMLLLWPRAHDSVHEVLPALAHGPHGFVLQKAPHVESGLLLTKISHRR